MVQQGAEGGQLLPVGQPAEKEQVGRLLKAEAALAHEAVDQVPHVDAAVDELALRGDLFPVLDVVARTLPIRVMPAMTPVPSALRSPPFHPEALIPARGDAVLLGVLSAYSLQEGKGLGIQFLGGFVEIHDGHLHIPAGGPGQTVVLTV